MSNIALHQKFIESDIRISTLFSLVGCFTQEVKTGDVNEYTPADQLVDYFAERKGNICDLFGDDVPDNILAYIAEDEEDLDYGIEFDLVGDFFVEVMAWLVGSNRLGFVAVVETPVNNSWGHTMSKWVYGETLDEIYQKAKEWRDLV